MFTRFSSVDDIKLEEVTHYEYIQDVSAQFELSLTTIWFQALMLSFFSFINFLSHFYFPKILMFHRQIKALNTINLFVVGTICFVVLIYTRFNDSAHFCTGNHLTEAEKEAQHLKLDQDKEFLIKRGDFLW